MRLKICGITKIEQAQAIVRLGATALGFICVGDSPRYLEPEAIATIIRGLPTEIDKIGVFAQAQSQVIADIVQFSGLTGVQLHGEESPEFCKQLGQLLSQDIEIIKAFRIKKPDSLTEVEDYLRCVDALLLDAYHPQLLGGSGQTLDWSSLREFKPHLPWFLAGGLTPDNLSVALAQVQPQGIDISSGVERSPGDKDVERVAILMEVLHQLERKGLAPS